MLWLDRGGTGPRTVLLLHGLGATAAVWSGMQAVLRRRTEVRWIAVDLPGHGGSAWEPHLLCRLDGRADRRALSGRGSALCGWSFARGVRRARPRERLVRGHRARGTRDGAEDHLVESRKLEAAQPACGRPVRLYPTAEEAWARYRRVSGLGADIAPDAHALARGAVPEEGGWRLAQDPATFAVAGAPFRLARSERGRARACSPAVRTIPWSRSRSCGSSCPRPVTLPGSGTTRTSRLPSSARLSSTR